MTGDLEILAREQLAHAIERLRERALRVEAAPEWRVLEGHMSRYSEEHWSAGWLHDLEFTVWERIVYARYDDSEDHPTEACDLHEMAVLALRLGGWVYWDKALPHVDYSRTRFVTFEEWVPLYRAWQHKQEERR